MDLFEPWRTAPPSRYAVESDSEDDVDPEDYGRHAEASRTASSRKRPEPSITVDLPKQSDLSEVIVAIEDAGRSWAEGLDNQTLQEAGSVTVDNKKVASISIQGKAAIVFYAGHLTYEGMHALAESLLDALPSQSITVIDSYSLPSYLSNSSADACIRILSSTPARAEKLPLRPFEPPNLVQGLAASLMSQGIERRIPSLLLLLPCATGESSSSSLMSHSARRQQIPEQIYDFGGPSPHEGGDSAAVKRDLQAAGSILGWEELGWKVPRPVATTSNGRRQTSIPGFGWWKEQRRLGEREIGEGAMYL